MWLIDEGTAREMRARLDAGLQITDAGMAAFEETVLGAREDGSPRNLNVAGDVAEITVEGLLTEKPDFWAWIFGLENTTYQSIVAAVAIAEANPAVKRLQFNINSPGGTVAGLFDALAAIQDAKKPSSVVTSFAASAAYALATVAGKITATNAAVLVGSIGVVMSFHVDENRVDITSTDAPNKRPDVTTEEGKAVIRKELDALHALFVGEIATGRGTTVADVNANFGRGSVLVANDAKAAGMIDKVALPPVRATRSAVAEDSTGGQAPAEPEAAPVVTEQPPSPAADGGGDFQPEEEIPMDLIELKTKHAAVYEEAVKVGVAAERDRVSAHLQMGETFGAMDIASDAIKTGAELQGNQSLFAAYQSAGKNRDDAAARQTETDAAVAAAGGATEPETQDLGDKVVAELERQGIAS